MIIQKVRRSISRKFILAVIATTFAAVLVSGLAHLAYDLHDFRTDLLQDLNAQAEILAQVSIAPLEFDGVADARATLEHLRTRTDVEAAAIYRKNGARFASFSRDGSTAAPDSPAMREGYTIDGNHLRLFKAIMRGDERIGTVYLHTAYPVDERIARDVRILAAVTGLSLLIAGIVSIWLQAAVTKPVRALTHAVQEVVGARDFSQRVAKTTDDEIGVLVDAFNGMLAEIGAHSSRIEYANNALQREAASRMKADEQLRELNNSLEERIAARTTELARANEQLRHAQKMEAIGQLTGGVAHDFNNVLQVISGNLQLLAMTLPGDASAQRRIDTARFATERGAKLSSQLLAFARRQPLQPAPTSLARILRAMDDMLRRALGECVLIETVVAGGLWNTLVDPYQLENVILNLAINARDAMNADGRLTLELGNAMLDDHYTRNEAEVASGQYVMLAISDTGSGMPPDVIARAFEPFFTTKREGEGTGLGLSMAYGFVKQSGGHIKIYSEPGNGTTIRIYLPRSHENESAKEDGRLAPVVGGAETVLVVEDDLSVQATAVDMLTELGYRVLKASDGQGALKLLETEQHVDMLFTDVVMPGPVRSPELARVAKEMLPDLAVLFTSGYTQNAIVHGGRLDPGVELISKPYRREDLARKIRHMLGNRQLAASLQAAPVPAPLPASRERNGLRIMLVEDDEENRELVAAMLPLLGHSVTAHTTAEEAIAAFGAGHYDVLLTDLNLPGMSGTELAEVLRGRAPALQVIVSTGAGYVAHAGSGYLALPKPYQVETLQRLLARLVAVGPPPGSA